MTAPVMLWADPEDAAVAYLADLFDPGKLRAGPEPADFTGLLPYCAVRRIDGGDDKVTDYPHLDLDLFDSADNYGRLSVLARRVHARMVAWSNKVTVMLPATDSTPAERVRIDRCLTIMAPVIVDYENAELVRMTGRYALENRAKTAA